MGSAAVHSLIPDHWVPFVLVGRKQQWSTGKTLLASGLGAASDALLSVVLGIVAILAGEEAIRRFEPYHERIEQGGIWILVGFGLLYAAWAFARSRREAPHFHLHFHGHSHEGHSHAHRDSALGKASMVTLILVAGMSPCFVSLPIFLGTVGHGTAFQLGVVGLYLGVTVACAVGISFIALRIHRELKLAFLERHAETISGLVIAGTGLALTLMEHEPHA